MANETVKVPDLGGAESVDVIEISVAVGDSVNPEDPLIVLESDKATMDVPSPSAGTVAKILVKEGDKLSEGDAILELSGESAEPAAEEPANDAPSVKEEEPVPEQQEAAVTSKSAALKEEIVKTVSSEMDIVTPDIGADEAEIIEVAVAEGDVVAEGDAILVLETDKATVEMPAPAAGTVLAIRVAEGGKIKQGDIVGSLQVEGQGSSETASEPDQAPTSAQVPAKSSSPGQPPQAAAEEKPAAANAKEPVQSAEQSAPSAEVYAGPAVRMFARKLGVDLALVPASGPRKRILKEDVEAYVKGTLEKGSVASGVTGGTGIPPIPEVDFSKFGDIEIVPMTRIQKLTAANMTRAWLNVPHVTQFDEADITELEAFRKSLKAEGERRNSKMTPLAFLVKACAKTLEAHPAFNRSISADGESFVQKHYVHVGIAVDTPRGLVVPVLRDANKKGLWELADEVNLMAQKARDGKLTPQEMQGGCFTISSLGAIGGTGFTPIVSAPEVAILGVSKSEIKPKWNGSEFVPRNMLPLGLSYDHRAINGADCGRFFTELVDLLSDIRRLAL